MPPAHWNNNVITPTPLCGCAQNGGRAPLGRRIASQSTKGSQCVTAGTWEPRPRTSL